VIEGSGIVPPPGHEPPVKAGEFVLGYPDETLELPEMPHPAALGRNASYLVYRKLYQDVAGFRRVLSREAHDPAEVELLAAKLMGRWRSGAPLVLAPQRDDAALAADAHRNNDFTYGADSHGLACPIGSHIRRSHPRDTLSPTERNRHRVIRRGLPYGPVLPEGAPDDGVDRGLAAMIGAASISRQFEFVQHTWINNRKFQGLENDKDPITGDHDGTTDMTLPRKPFHKRIVGFPRFVTVRGGGYFFLPGISGVRYLAG
jgi:Dyp-type peroxidase family